VSAVLADVLVTLDTSAWYFGNAILLVVVVVALAVWGFYTSIGGRMRITQSTARTAPSGLA
jgi:hypothetical protein